MGFTKNADGDQANTIERVFEDMDEVLEEIASHADPDRPPVVVEVPGTQPPPAGEAN